MSVTNTFGPALRGWRRRVRPADLGIEDFTPRRVHGLRREELARVAGLSVDYVISLEQGRSRNPSAQVVAAIANALRLRQPERDHLFRCAGLVAPRGDVPMDMPSGAQRLVDRFHDIPVAVFAADWTLLRHNPMWALAAGHPDTYDWPLNNLAAATFLQPSDRNAEEIGPWALRSPEGPEAVEAAVAADLRATATNYPADTRLAALIDRMIAESPRFAELWSSGTVRPHGGQIKIIEHPVVGDITVTCEVLMVPGVDLKILALMPAPDSPDADRLDQLRSGSSG